MDLSSNAQGIHWFQGMKIPIIIIFNLSWFCCTSTVPLVMLIPSNELE